MARLETAIERWVCRKAWELYGIKNIKINTTTETGWPDRMFLLPSKPLFIEFKREGEEPRPKQVYIHKLLRLLKYDIETHDNREEALASIKSHLDARTIPADSSKISSIKTRSRTIP